MRAPISAALIAVASIATLGAALGATACGGHAASPLPAPLSNAAPAGPAVHEPLASLDRSACYGTCPVYKVTIFRDGIVEYVGERFVKVTGKASIRLSAPLLDELDQLFRTAHYLELKSAYTVEAITDMPSVDTSYAPAGHPAKVVRHYLGDRSAPDALGTVEDGIDRIVHIERWVGTTAERDKLKP